LGSPTAAGPAAGHGNGIEPVKRRKPYEIRVCGVKNRLALHRRRCKSGIAHEVGRITNGFGDASWWRGEPMQVVVFNHLELRTPHGYAVGSRPNLPVKVGEKRMKRTLMMMILAVSAAPLMVGCEKNDASFEKAGRKMDQAAEKAGDKLEKAGDKVDEAAKDVKRKVQDATD
jgi:hypothetical protein